MQLGTKRNCKAVEEKLLGFVLGYKLAFSELHGSEGFVKCVSRFCVKIRLCESNIRQHSTADRRAYLLIQRYPKCFCCLVQVSYHGFNQKKVEEQTFLGFVLLV